jgi:hypothetical protein
MYRHQTRGPWRFQFLTQLLGLLEDTHTVHILRCTIANGIQRLFDTSASNDPDSTDPIVQIGRFQILKGYIPNERKSAKYYQASSTGEQRTKQLLMCF